MKRIQLLILGVLIFNLTSSQTHVSGTVDGETWTPAGSPYIMDGDLFIASLVIEPGVTILANGNYVIEVAGIIQAIGTAQDSIRFTKPDSITGWQGILFNVTTFESELQYCIIEHSTNSGIRVINSTPVIQNCTFVNNSGTWGGAIHFSSDTETGSEFTLSNCSFYYNNSSRNGGAINVNLTDGHVIIINSIFKGNIANPSHSTGGFVGGAVRIYKGDATIRNCKFIGNRSNSECSNTFNCSVLARGGAIFIDSDGIVLIENNVFLNNRANARNNGNWNFGGSSKSHGGAIYAGSGTVTISNNVMAYNRTTRSNCGPSTGGGGVYVNGGAVSITNCNLVYNPDATGIHRAGGTLDVMNSIVFFNNQQSTQIGGMDSVIYCNVQDGYAGAGNISNNPVFIKDDSTFHLTSISPCIDAGKPDTLNDVCFPPSLGDVRNDIGAYGGPGACNWSVASEILQIENDLAVHWLEPGNAPLCGTGKEQQIIVQVKNKGKRAVTNFKVGYSIDDGDNFVHERIYKTVLPGDSLDYEFRRTADMDTSDTYNCIAVVSIPHDIDNSNDTIRQQIQNDRIIISLETTDTECNKAEGVAKITSIDGRDGPFNIQWTNGQTSMVADNLASGVYYVTVSDAQGCRWTQPVIINDQGAPEISFDQSTINNISCFGKKDGSISISPSQGTAPYTFQWSNGELTKDINGLGKGQYDVTVKDSEGCSKTHSFSITEPMALSVRTFRSDANCGELNGSASVLVKGGTEPYQYFWSNGNTTSSLTGLAGGIYDVTIKDNNWCLDSAKISIDEIDAPTLVVSSIEPASCGSNDGAVSINLADASFNYNYSWSNGETTKDLNNIKRGFYTVTVSFEDGSCSTNEIIEVPERMPDPGSICMVTIDSITGANIVVLKIPDNPTNISSYNIYKLGKSGTYQFLDAMDQLSNISEDPGSVADITSYRYRMTLVDHCGNESEPSEVHETIHTVVSPDFNLTRANIFWNSYKGFDYNSFKIFRYSNSLGFEVLDTVPKVEDKGFYTYTDLNPPINDTVYYVIGIDLEEPCISLRKASTHNTVRSNKTKKLKFGPGGDPGTGTDISSLKNLVIYPNPNKGSFKVSMETASTQDVTLRVYDPQGRIINNLQFERVTGKHEKTIELSMIKPGLYYLQIFINNGMTVKPFFVE